MDSLRTKSDKERPLFGSIGANMLRSLKHSNWLPNYDHESVRAILREIDELYTYMDETIKAANNEINDYGIACTIFTHNSALLRNKRILCAYHRYRMDCIEDLRWDKGGVLNTFYKNKLNPMEQLYFNEYNKLLANYIQRTDIEITSNLLPPKKFKNGDFSGRKRWRSHFYQRFII